MKYAILNLVQGSPEWLDARKKPVTASQVPVILGVSQYQKPHELLWEKFTGITPEVDAFKQILFRRGHEAEAVGRKWLEKKLGYTLKPAVLLSTEVPDLLASLDGLNIEHDVQMEAKYMGAKALAEVAAGKIKPAHYYQVQAQLRVSGVSKCIYFAVDGSGHAKIAEIKPDPSAFELIEDAIRSFMTDLNELRMKHQAYLDCKAMLETKYTPKRKTRKKATV